MFDSTNADDIGLAFQPGDMIAAYADGSYVDYAQALADFPGATVISIDVDPAHHDAMVYDCERGNGVPADAPGWRSGALDAGIARPTVYCNLSTAPAVVAAFARQVAPDLWVADWTGRPHTVTVAGANVVAVQYDDPSTGSGGHYDRSVVLDDTWHAQPATAPPVEHKPPVGPPAFFTFPGFLIHEGMDGNPVSVVQSVLWHRGWAIKVDGDFGPDTFKVVEAFQAQHALKEDGVVGPVTWPALWTASGAAWR
jgi:hypothetical protein